MKMKNVLVAVILGLLTVVQMSPINTVTQIPTKAEDEVLREAVTDGFLVDHFFPSTLSTTTSKSNTSTSAAERAVSTGKVAIGEASEESTTSGLIRHGGKDNSTTTPHPKESTFSSFNSPTSQNPQSSFTSSSVPNEDHSSVTSDHILVSQTTALVVPSFDFLSTLSSDSGSGDGEDTAPTSSVASISSTETSTASSTSVASKVHPRLFADVEGSGSGLTAETSTASSTSTIARRLFTEAEGSGVDMTLELTTVKNPNVKPRLFSNQFTQEGLKLQKVKEHVTHASPRSSERTPSWIIILGFIVGVAALVLLCVAIATRDKWNGPNQASKAENKSVSSTQQRGLEMETFLHKEEPRENGKAAEYTVIPLDELPESSLSH